MDAKVNVGRKTAERIVGVLRDPSYRMYVVKKLLDKCGVDLDRLLKATGYRFEFLDRVVLYRVWDVFLATRGTKDLEALEVSPGENSRWRYKGFKSYEAVQYPTFDICTQRLDRVFDVIIIDNVLEHVHDALAAVRNAFAMLRPGGVVMIAVPFLIKIHGAPDDYWRWTEQGIRRLAEQGGFIPANIMTGSWGNRACVKASFNRWPMQGWRRRLKNEPVFPVMVWCVACKST